MVVTPAAIVQDADHLSHEDACRVYHAAMNWRVGRVVVIDLSNVLEATTAAFARLVLLRRALLESGRDLRLEGLHAQPARLYEVNRLHNVLPCRHPCAIPGDLCGEACVQLATAQCA